MKSWLTVAALVALGANAGTARAQNDDEVVTPLPTQPSGNLARVAPPPEPVFDHPTPRLALSYERFSAGNVDGSSVPLEALHLDSYFLSWRWLRAGLEAEAGRGHATLYGGAASLKYGMLGLDAGLQLPGRVTPFVEGRLDGGILYGSLDGPVAIPGTTATVSGFSAATYLYARGLDAGVDLYVLGRSYLTLSVGWLRTTWGSADYEAMLASSSTGLKFKDVTHDSVLFKIGLGI
jgi:hypothetical protein